MDANRALKSLMYEQVERMTKSMANAKRLELIELLCQSPKSVEMLANETGISVKLASAHLKELRMSRLVETEKQGRQVIYRVACPEVAGLLVTLRTLAMDRMFELQHALQNMAASGDHWEETDGDALMRKAKRGLVTVIDVRPASEYEQQHLPYARSVPLAELSKRLRELPKDKPIVAYCRGPFCLMSADAVILLKKAGFKAYSWCGGAADWLAEKAVA